jgi:hypothetical protein
VSSIVGKYERKNILTLLYIFGYPLEPCTEIWRFFRFLDFFRMLAFFPQKINISLGQIFMFLNPFPEICWVSWASVSFFETPAPLRMKDYRVEHAHQLHLKNPPGFLQFNSAPTKMDKKITLT